MARQYKSILHCPLLDQPVKATYFHIDRDYTSNWAYELEQGESGKFYCDAADLGNAIHELDRYGRDHYDYRTWMVKITVSIRPGLTQASPKA